MEHKCTQCGKVFKIMMYQNLRRKFCDWRCRNEFLHAQQKKYAHCTAWLDKQGAAQFKEFERVTKNVV